MYSSADEHSSSVSAGPATKSYVARIDLSQGQSTSPGVTELCPLRSGGFLWSPEVMTIDRAVQGWPSVPDSYSAFVSLVAQAGRSARTEVQRERSRLDQTAIRFASEIGLPFTLLVSLQLLADNADAAHASTEKASKGAWSLETAGRTETGHLSAPSADGPAPLYATVAADSSAVGTTPFHLETEAGDGSPEHAPADTETFSAVSFGEPRAPALQTSPALATDANAGLPDADGPRLLIGTDAVDILIGGSGNDTLRGAAGDDILVSGDGDDQLDGGEGADLLIGGLGNDLYIVDNAFDTVVEESDAGNDTVATTLTHYSLERNVERLVALSDADFSGTGNDQANVIQSLAGNDTLSGAAGDDVLVSGAGDDRLDGGEGADLLIGGLGDDVYVIDDAGDIVLEASGQGRDKVETNLQAYALADGLENLTYTGSDAFQGTGNNAANVIVSGDGDDWLQGDAADTLADAVVEVIAEEALSNLLGVPSDILVFRDEPVEVAIYGAAAATNEIIIGSRQNDRLFGTAGGNDSILAGGGNDTIEGGAGDDWLTGGIGNDRFIFRPGFGNDVITDFSDTGGNRDTIYLAGFNFGSFSDIETSIQQVGNDVVIQISPADQIILADVDKMTLALEDRFIF